MKARTRLLFGIPELDRMLDLQADTVPDRTFPGEVKAQGDEGDVHPSSMSIVGPDGTGKSVLAMHLASRYAGETGPATRVIYVSTDLKFLAAEEMWTRFSLGCPFLREIPSERARRAAWRTSRPSKPVGFDPYAPVEEPGKRSRSLFDFLAKGGDSSVAFLDLASYSAGDDWGFVTRLVTHLSGVEAAQPHLVIVDSIAGLETLVGETDAFGERASRRARVAQVMRAVEEHCHLVLVVEEPKPGEVLPEEYVTDVVIRLRRQATVGSTWRTIEIEKSRARGHAMGQHPFEILDARGSSTGRWQNPDEPECQNSYVQIYYSLHHRDRRVSSLRTPGTGELYGRVAQFGIVNLDDMLPEPRRAPGSMRTDERNASPSDAVETPLRGLPWGSFAVLIGEAHTGKSALAYSFLCQSATEYATRLASLSAALLASPSPMDALLDACAWIKGWRPSVTGGRLPGPGGDWEYDAEDVSAEALTRDEEHLLRSAVGARDWHEVSRQVLAFDRHGALIATLFGDYAATVKYRIVRRTTRKGSTADDGAPSGFVAMGAPPNNCGTSVEGVGPIARSQYPWVWREWRLPARSAHVAAVPTPVETSVAETGLDATGPHTVTVDTTTVRMTVTPGPAAEAPAADTSIAEAPAPAAGDISDRDAVHLLAEWLLNHPAFCRPMVLVTTHDIKSDDLAQTFASWLLPTADTPDTTGERSTPLAVLIRSLPNDIVRIRETLSRYIARHLICRRLDVRGTPTPRLFHTIERCWVEAERMIYGSIVPPVSEDRHKRCWRIRFVLDDCRILRDMYPNLREDPLFLPFLRYSARAEGITSLIVDTDQGRPDQQASNEWSQELRSLASDQILTWPVPFFGESISAITVMPGSTRIRQLISSGRSVGAPRPRVDPHLEMYQGVERGEARSVPLQVRLHAETPAFDDYIREENRLFREAFGGGSLGANPEVIVGLTSTEYEGLRDMSHVSVDTRRDHSLVFQVDGFWALRRQVLGEKQQDYLNDDLDRRQQDDDPFGLFRSSVPMAAANGSSSSAETKPADSSPQRRRKLNYFRNAYYETRLPEHDRMVDRVPFTWDFGFLLLRNDCWREAAASPLPLLVNHCVTKALAGRPPDEGEVKALTALLSRRLTVERVRYSLRHAVDPLAAGGKGRSPNTLDAPELAFAPGDASQEHRDVLARLFEQKEPDQRSDVAERLSHLRLDSWRAFFEATRIVAERAEGRSGRSVTAYEVASAGPESMCCQVLEVWLSEIVRSRGTKACSLVLGDTSAKKSAHSRLDGPKVDLLHLLESDGSEPNGLRCSNGDRLGLNCLLLYKTWLLFLEVMDFESFCSPSNHFEFDLERKVSLDAAAARHWYKTACVATASAERAGHSSDTYVPVRLPGHFSVRGDWYLAIAKGSRSIRLANRAIDLLSSRRANLRRMQLGLGLPTRDLIAGDGTFDRDLRTAIRTCSEEALTKNLTYGELDSLAGRPFDDAHKKGSGDFYWLWRSGLKDYDRQTRAFQRWIYRIFSWTHAYRQQRRHEWTGGFVPYDWIEREEWKSLGKFDSYTTQFGDHVSRLISELKALRGQD